MLNKFHHDFHMKSLFLPKCSLLWLHVNVLKSNLKFSASLGEAVVLSGFQEPGFLSLELRAQKEGRVSITMMNGWERSTCLDEDS